MASPMIIYSWNILFSNRSLEKAFAFIRDADADIFCLQEVPEAFVERLRTLPYAVASVQETERIDADGRRIRQELVVLSRYPLQNIQKIELPRREMQFGKRSRFFARLMVWIFGWALGTGERNALVVDVTTPTGSLHIYNLHLSLTNPAWRLEEFEHALQARDPKTPTIVCGDFNVLETPHITLLNWMFGGKFSDIFRNRRERTHIEKQFVAHELKNPLRGKRTQTLSRSQLDHILIPHTLSIRNARVLTDRMGSDHHPISVETT